MDPPISHVPHRGALLEMSWGSTGEYTEEDSTSGIGEREGGGRGGGKGRGREKEGGRRTGRGREGERGSLSHNILLLTTIIFSSFLLSRIARTS